MLVRIYRPIYKINTTSKAFSIPPFIVVYRVEKEKNFFSRSDFYLNVFEEPTAKWLNF